MLTNASRKYHYFIYLNTLQLFLKYTTNVPRVLRFYQTVGVPWFRDKPNNWLKGSEVLGRIGPSVNSGALMSVVEVQGFWEDQLVVDC